MILTQEATTKLNIVIPTFSVSLMQLDPGCWTGQRFQIHQHLKIFNLRNIYHSLLALGLFDLDD